MRPRLKLLHHRRLRARRKNEGMRVCAYLFWGLVYGFEASVVCVHALVMGSVCLHCFVSGFSWPGWRSALGVHGYAHSRDVAETLHVKLVGCLYRLRTAIPGRAVTRVKHYLIAEPLPLCSHASRAYTFLPFFCTSHATSSALHWVVQCPNKNTSYSSRPATQLGHVETCWPQKQHK